MVTLNNINSDVTMPCRFSEVNSRPCGASATSCSFLPGFSFVKRGAGIHLSSSSMFASAGSLIRSVFKTSAASMNFAAKKNGLESVDCPFTHATAVVVQRSAESRSVAYDIHPILSEHGNT